jgi:hypothetical protein
MFKMLKTLLSRPWGPAWSAPVLAMWPAIVCLWVALGPQTDGLWYTIKWLFGISVLATIPFIILGIAACFLEARYFNEVAMTGLIVTVVFWSPSYIAALEYVNDSLGHIHYLMYPAYSSPLFITICMLIAWIVTEWRFSRGSSRGEVE